MPPPVVPPDDEEDPIPPERVEYLDENGKPIKMVGFCRRARFSKSRLWRERKNWEDRTDVSLAKGGGIGQFSHGTC